MTNGKEQQLLSSAKQTDFSLEKQFFWNSVTESAISINMQYLLSLAVLSSSSVPFSNGWIFSSRARAFSTQRHLIVQKHPTSSTPLYSTPDKEENYLADNGDNVDVYGDRTDITDPEILESMRLARVRYNDGWQSTLLHDTHGGDWAGQYEILVPRFEGEEVFLNKAERGEVHTSLTVMQRNELGYFLRWKEDYQPRASAGTVFPSSLRRETKVDFAPSDMRVGNGHNCVGGAFTSCSVGDSEYTAEIGIRDGESRVRVRYTYEKESAGGWSVRGIAIIREQRGTNASALSYDPSALGQGIYDPQIGQEEEANYLQLPLGGRLTLLFPRSLTAQPKAVLTMEHIGTLMRYQVDRIFPCPPGEKISTLELTEVRTDDSDAYPAGFLPRPDFLQ